MGDAYSLGIKAHLQDHIKVAKFRINSIWNTLLNKNNMTVKYWLNGESLKQPMGQNMQEWGYLMEEELEKIF